MSNAAPLVWRAAAGLALGLGLFFAFTSPASAVAGLERVAAQSSANSVNKSAAASCPSGKRVVGAGGRLSGGSGEVVMDAIVPHSDLTKVTARGTEDETGFAGNWSVTAYAICAYEPPGLVWFFSQSVTSTGNKQATVSCPSGKRVLGAGGQIVGGSGQVVLDAIVWDSPHTSVAARGSEDQGGFAGSWSVSAFAICATPPPGDLRGVAAQSSSDSANNKSATVSCPAGRRVVGAGSWIASELRGQVFLGQMVPDSALKSVTATGVEDETGFGGNWKVVAYALCASIRPHIVSATSPTSSSNKSVTASCPTGERVIGAGGRIQSGFGEVGLGAIAPNNALTGVLASGREDENGFVGNWSVSAYAICAVVPPAGLQWVPAGSPGDSADNKFVNASCPSGKQVIGTGGQIAGGSGQVFLTGITPNSGLTVVTARGSEDETGYAGSWAVFAYAICAPPPTGLKRVFEASPSDSGETKSVTASCGFAGGYVIGAGGGIAGGSGEVVLDEMVPFVTPLEGLKNVAASGSEDENGFAGNWSVTASAICAFLPG